MLNLSPLKISLFSLQYVEKYITFRWLYNILNIEKIVFLPIFFVLTMTCWELLWCLLCRIQRTFCTPNIKQEHWKWKDWKSGSWTELSTAHGWPLQKPSNNLLGFNRKIIISPNSLALICQHGSDAATYFPFVWISRDLFVKQFRWQTLSTSICVHSVCSCHLPPTQPKTWQPPLSPGFVSLLLLFLL